MHSSVQGPESHSLASGGHKCFDRPSPTPSPPIYTRLISLLHPISSPVTNLWPLPPSSFPPFHSLLRPFPLNRSSHFRPSALILPDFFFLSPVSTTLHPLAYSQSSHHLFLSHSSSSRCWWRRDPPYILSHPAGATVALTGSDTVSWAKPRLSHSIHFHLLAPDLTPFSGIQPHQALLPLSVCLSSFLVSKVRTTFGTE